MVQVLGDISPYSGGNIVRAGIQTQEPVVMWRMLEAARMQVEDVLAFDLQVKDCEQDEHIYRELNQDVFLQKFQNSEKNSIFTWGNGEEWETIKAGIMKDKESIVRSAEIFDLEPRMLLVGLVGEQLRLFYSQREMVKQFFAPLKILGNANKISLGVMGIKEMTAQDIEKHLKDPDSEYYLGKEYENVLDGCSQDVQVSRYDCLTSEKDKHFFSYLYGAAYMKQILSQWQRAGFDIQYRPEILGTLYNVGFSQSHPKSDPKVGGSILYIGEKEYTFGRIAYEFYYSGELGEDFPYKTEKEKKGDSKGVNVIRK